MIEPLVLATRNVGKLRELAPMFAAAGIEVVDLATAGVPGELPGEADVESFPTFAENALAKARFYGAALGGRPCVADDSGLEVRALGGVPGVHSRRWAAVPGLDGPALDAANNRRLVAELAGAADRRARFVCAAAYAHGARELVCLGAVDGEIVLEPSGAFGFGYDPHFRPNALGKTLAEASLAEKERVSHRGAAFRALITALGRGN
jgi:XTP/dITP diphosphohydrolase